MAFNDAQKLLGIRCAADIIRACRHGIVLTGAGISTPSGIPDFRSPNSGLWEHIDPFEVASLSAFRHTPEKFFNWFKGLAEVIFQAEPNLAHTKLVDLEKSGHLTTIITQNIDGLHQRAGSTTILEVHGTIHKMTCVSCYHHVQAQPFIEAYQKNERLPTCPECGSILKPDVVLLGEQLPARTWLQAVEASKKCELILVIGSSLEMLPIARLPLHAIEHGAHLILINQSRTYLDMRADVVFHDEVTEILPRIVSEVLNG